jgi:hypothetical protein
MDTIKTIELVTTGQDTGHPYSGNFEVKTVLSRRDRFAADQKRREVLGPGGDSALPTLQGEAFMIGQLWVRVVKAPDWWSNANCGLDLKDENVTPELFELALKAESDAVKELQSKAKSSLEKLSENKLP